MSPARGRRTVCACIRVLKQVCVCVCALRVCPEVCAWGACMAPCVANGAGLGSMASSAVPRWAVLRLRRWWARARLAGPWMPGTC